MKFKVSEHTFPPGVSALVREKRILDMLVQAFSVDLKLRLFKQANDGRRGWDDDSWNETQIIENLRSQLNRRNMDVDPVDVAAYAMFLWNRKERREFFRPEEQNEVREAARKMAAKIVESATSESRTVLPVVDESRQKLWAAIDELRAAHATLATQVSQHSVRMSMMRQSAATLAGNDNGFETRISALASTLDQVMARQRADSDELSNLKTSVSMFQAAIRRIIQDLSRKVHQLIAARRTSPIVVRAIYKLMRRVNALEENAKSRVHSTTLNGGEKEIVSCDGF